MPPLPPEFRQGAQDPTLWGEEDQDPGEASWSSIADDYQTHLVRMSPGLEQFYPSYPNIDAAHFDQATISDPSLEV
jgi:hypothetical protein